MSGATVFTVLRDHHAALHPLLQVRADYARSNQHVCTQRGKFAEASMVRIDRGKERDDG